MYVYQDQIGPQRLGGLNCRLTGRRHPPLPRPIGGLDHLLGGAPERRLVATISTRTGAFGGVVMVGSVCRARSRSAQRACPCLGRRPLSRLGVQASRDSSGCGPGSGAGLLVVGLIAA